MRDKVLFKDEVRCPIGRIKILGLWDGTYKGMRYSAAVEVGGCVYVTQSFFPEECLPPYHHIKAELLHELGQGLIQEQH